MQNSDIPIKMPTPWAASAGSPYSHTVPIPSQIGITDGRASFTTGYPPLNFLPESSGGVPPFGDDVNGVTNATTAWLRWVQAGGLIPYDATFQAAIGGYPKGAIVAPSDGSITYLWVSQVTNNMVDPNADGPAYANWQYFYIGFSGVTPGTYYGPITQVGIDGRITSIANPAGWTSTDITASGLYTPPAGVRRIWARIVAAGGGRTGAGGDTIFNGVTFKGGGAPSGQNGGNPGGTGSGACVLRIGGQTGSRGQGFAIGANSADLNGGMGAGTPFGQGAPSDLDAIVNTGAGAGGTHASGTGTQTSQGGGASGEYGEIIINSVSANYAVTIGAGGLGGGGSGRVFAMEFYA